jgi:TusA-related sulfurtransferase/peroxiredoxin family protein
MTQTIDCRGQKCPEPVLRTARAARQLSNVGGTFEVLADDDAFPADVRSWCRSSGATLVALDDVSGAHRAVIQVLKKHDATPTSPATPGARAATPVLDCRGKQCPEPVLTIARHARTTPGAVEVLADDEAFGADVEAWCRSAGASLVSLAREGATFRARIEVPAGSSRVPPSAVAKVPSAPPGAITTLDCRGKQCPEPVLALARFARGNPGAEVEIMADDPAFPADVESYCRSSGATELLRSQEGPVLRVRLRTAKRIGAAALTPTPPPAVAAMVPVSSMRPNEGPSARFDFTAMSGAMALAEAERVATLGSGLLAELVLPDGPTAQAVLKTFSARGHEIVELTVGSPSRLVARLTGTSTGLAVRTDGPECTLLVLHNDLEVLLAALIVANGAAAAGMKVMIFFTFWGLNTLRGDRPNREAEHGRVSFFQWVFKKLMPRGPRKMSLGQLNFGGVGSAILGGIMRKQNVSELPSLLASAEDLGVRFVACTMSMGVMGITKRDLHPYKNLEFAGVATFVDAAKTSKMSLVF